MKSGAKANPAYSLMTLDVLKKEKALFYLVSFPRQLHIPADQPPTLYRLPSFPVGLVSSPGSTYVDALTFALRAGAVFCATF